jgi:small subunit ribosomal protein S2
MNNKIAVKDLLEAGVHFGHKTGRANPKMKPYIYGERNGIHIVNLDLTAKLFNDAYQTIVNTVAGGEQVLFVGTKRQAQEIIKEEAKRSNQFFVTNRWLGGMLTNFVTIKKNLERLKDIEKMEVDGRLEAFTKKEQLEISREKEKLIKYVGGIHDMRKLPGALFVIDVKKEHIACSEARKLGIPIVAVVDTNCDPEQVDHVIPGNDDALRAIRLFAERIADAAIEGSAVFEERSRADSERRRADTDDRAAEEGRRKAAAPARPAKEAAPAAELAQGEAAVSATESPATTTPVAESAAAEAE